MAYVLKGRGRRLQNTGNYVELRCPESFLKVKKKKKKRSSNINFS